ncbi:MAG: hypothetical protein OXC65_02485 [Thiotrichales bacterium]|nr:hypothetical protein [Thiotrichales bacterium]
MGARIVIMNPPFTNRTKMGEKFPDEVQNALRQRVDALESGLIRNDPERSGTRGSCKQNGDRTIV